jgi:hypothetical protein
VAESTRTAADEARAWVSSTLPGPGG